MTHIWRHLNGFYHCLPALLTITFAGPMGRFASLPTLFGGGRHCVLHVAFAPIESSAGEFAVNATYMQIMYWMYGSLARYS